MAEYTDSYFIQIGTIELDYSGTQTVSTGWVDIDLSRLPEHNYHFFQFIFDNHSTGNYNASISFVINDNVSTYQINASYMEISLGGIATKYKVDVSGTNSSSSGYLYLQYASERLYFHADTETVPVMDIVSVDKYKISNQEGFMWCTVGLTSSLELQYWELRATLPNEETGHGKGLLVEYFTHLYAGETKWAYVETDELTKGDGEYLIKAYGQSVNGVWSDEIVNLLDLSTDVGWVHNASISNDIVYYNTGSSNVEYSGIAIDLYLNDEYQRTVSYVESTGSHYVILKKDASFDSFALVMSGDGDYGAITINASMMENGLRYLFSYNVDSLLLNSASISSLSIVNVVTPENLFDLYNDVVWSYNTIIDSGTVTYNTGTSNTEYAKIVIDLFLQGDYIGSILRTETTGNKTAIFNKDSSFDSFAIMLSGDSGYGSIECNTLMMEDGSSYQMSLSVDSLSLNHAVVSNITLVKVVD